MTTNSIVGEIRQAQVALHYAGRLPTSVVTLTPEEYTKLRAECAPMAVYPTEKGTPETIYGLTINVDPSVAGTPLSERFK